MNVKKKAGAGVFLRWARGLRFPELFFLTAGLFLLDIAIPDMIPFVDEILLGLATLLLATWKRRKKEEPSVGSEED